MTLGTGFVADVSCSGCGSPARLGRRALRSRSKSADEEDSQICAIPAELAFRDHSNILVFDELRTTKGLRIESLLLLLLRVGIDLLQVFARQLIVRIDFQGPLEMKLSLREVTGDSEGATQVRFRVSIVRM